MKMHVFGVATGVALLCAAPLLVSPGLAVEPHEEAAAGYSAQKLVEVELEAEASGDNQRREYLLRRALSKDPESASARWHSGFLRVDDQWVRV